MPRELELLEQQVMEMLLAGDDPTLSVLREQFRAADVTEHELTGAGFFTNFSVPAEVPRLIGNKAFQFGDVQADIQGLQHGAGFVLFVSDGALDCLEGFSFDEPWPDNMQTFRVSYIDGEKRDLAALRQKWNE